MHLVAHATLGQSPFTQAADGLSRHLTTSGLDQSRATAQAYARLYNGIIAQATTLAYVDMFWVLCAGAAIMSLLSFALRKNQVGVGRQLAVE